MSVTKSFSSEKNVLGLQKTCEAAAQGRRGGRSRSLGRPASSFFRENASLVIKTSKRHGGGSSGGRRAHEPRVSHPACPALAHGEDPPPRVDSQRASALHRRRVRMAQISTTYVQDHLGSEKSRPRPPRPGPLRGWPPLGGSGAGAHSRSRENT